MYTPSLANTGLVSNGGKNGDPRKRCTPTQPIPPTSPDPPRPDPPSTHTPLFPGLPLIWEQRNNHSILPTATNIIMASLRSGTSKLYQTYLKRWEKYCQSNGLGKFEATMANEIEFLATLFSAGLVYSAINTARSALSSVMVLPNNITFGSHPLVVRFLKGVFKFKPSLPRYNRIWDVAAVLQYLKTLGPTSELDLKTLTTKTTMLLRLLIGQRCQTLTKLDINFMQILPYSVVFTVGDKWKTIRLGKHLQPIELIAYNQDKTLCVVSHLHTYLTHTQPLRGQHPKLLISYAKPYKPLALSTVNKWAKAVLKEAGVDTTGFSGKSALSASTSCSAQSGLPIKDILKAAVGPMQGPLLDTITNQCNPTLAAIF